MQRTIPWPAGCPLAVKNTRRLLIGNKTGHCLINSGITGPTGGASRGGGGEGEGIGGVCRGRVARCRGWPSRSPTSSAGQRKAGVRRTKAGWVTGCCGRRADSPGGRTAPWRPVTPGMPPDRAAEVVRGLVPGPPPSAMIAIPYPAARPALRRPRPFSSRSAAGRVRPGTATVMTARGGSAGPAGRRSRPAGRAGGRARPGVAGPLPLPGTGRPAPGRPAGAHLRPVAGVRLGPGARPGDCDWPRGRGRRWAGLTAIEVTGAPAPGAGPAR